MKKISIVLFVFIVANVFTSGFRTTLGSTVGVTWVKYPGNPLNLGTSLTWPWVVYDGQMFKMWYTNLTEQSDAQNICFADSSDGIDWTRHGMVLNKGEAGSWDSGAIMGAVILYDGTTYKMWYLGMALVRACSVGYATSSDGIHWSKDSGNPVMTPGGNGGWDNWHIAQISIIFNGTHYIMWYGAQAVPDCNVAMGVAISVDGVSWTKYQGNPVLVGGPGGWDSAHIFPGPVIGSGGQYEMWYYGQPRDLPGSIGLATSPDGFSWSKYGGNPVLESGPAGAWDSATVHHPCVLERDGDMLMWYSGLDWTGTQRIGLALSYAPCTVATVDFDPDALNLKSSGKWITAYIELPSGHDVADINVSSIMLNATVSAERTPTSVGDYDGDGVPELIAKFDRTAVQQYILSNSPIEAKFMTAALTITGRLNDGTPFQGSDTIKIVFPTNYWKIIYLEKLGKL